jgi:hypothetical protein
MEKPFWFLAIPNYKVSAVDIPQTVNKVFGEIRYKISMHKISQPYWLLAIFTDYNDRFTWSRRWTFPCKPSHKVFKRCWNSVSCILTLKYKFWCFFFSALSYVGVTIGFIDTLYTPLVTTCNYSAIDDKHTLQFTVTHIRTRVLSFH